MLRSGGSLASALVLALEVSGCGGPSGAGGSGPGNGDGGSGSAFVGTWQCTVIGGGQVQPQQTVVDITADGAGISWSSADTDGGGGCPATASVSGSTATFAPSQGCGKDGGAYTLTSGNATIDGNSLTYSTSFALGNATDTLNGTCVRQ
jgi:hypothetical protein